MLYSPFLVFFVDLDEDFLHFDAPKLDTLLGHWLLTLCKKKDGSSYEPGSVKALHSGISRHCKLNQYGYDISSSELFVTSRNVLI